MTRLTIVVLVGTLLVAAAAFGQTTPIPQRLSLEDALRLAAERHPQVVAARSRLQIAEANQVDASLRPNPTFTAESELFDSQSPFMADAQEFAVRLDQEIETAGRRRLRLEVAAAGVAAAQLTARDELRRFELTVRRIYLQLALAQADTEVARTSLEEVDQVLEVSRERVRLGEAARSEVSRLEVERLRFADDALAADLASRNARASLLAVLGSTDLTRDVEATDALSSFRGLTADVVRVGASADTAAGIDGRQDVLALREGVRKAEAETRLQRALGAPNVTLGGGYKRDFGSNAAVIGVTLPLPFGNRNQGAIARAAAEHRVAQSELADIELTVRLDIQHATNAVEIAQARLDYIEQRVLTNARSARDVVRESYRLGAVDLIDVLDAQRAFRDTLYRYNRALFDRHISLFELSAARGATSLQP